MSCVRTHILPHRAVRSVPTSPPITAVVTKSCPGTRDCHENPISQVHRHHDITSNQPLTIATRELHPLEGEARHILQCAADDDMAAKRVRFLQASDRLREKTRGRKQTPAEVLIREDRDHGHRDNF